MLGQSSKVVIVPQRQIETDMMKESCRKNLDRNQKDLDQNPVFKVVRRKEEKREIKVSLRQGKGLDQEGSFSGRKAGPVQVLPKMG